MPNLRITKTLSLDHQTVEAVESIAKNEKRSFTRQVEIMLENALQRNEPVAAKSNPKAKGKVNG